MIQLQEWLERDGYTYPAMLMEGALPNFFTINGKAYPGTDTIKMEVGERLRIRFIGSNNNFVHPMHVHGGPFEIVETDGNVVPEEAQILKDTVNVGPGERYDVIWEARRPGKWLLPLPHPAPHHQRQHRAGGRRRPDDRNQRDRVARASLERIVGTLPSGEPSGHALDAARMAGQRRGDGAQLRAPGLTRARRWTAVSGEYERVLTPL